MLAQVIANSHSTVPNLGASGAIAAVMGAFLVIYPRDRIRVLLVIFLFVRVTLIPGALLIGVWFLIQLFNAGSVRKAEHCDRIARDSDSRFAAWVSGRRTRCDERRVSAVLA